MRLRVCSRIAFAGAIWLAGAPAFAQTVQVFDDAPSIEQLRSIMIPESQPGTGRTIVIQRPDGEAPAPAVQQASTAVRPAPRTPVTSAELPEAGVVKAAVSTAAPPEARPAAGTVGFRISFGFDSAVLPNSAHTMIERVAQVLKEAPDIRVRVEGHTDASGSADYNMALSERRALSVGEYLVKLGVEPSRLMLIGKGPAEPLTQNKYDPANRRVQFVREG
jgi:outer membrane protein OmpA-like peptidoglycan-associated protein